MIERFFVDKWVVDELYEYKSVQVTWPTEVPDEGMFFVVDPSGSQSVLVERVGDTLESRQHLLDDNVCCGIKGRSAEQKIALNYLLNPNIPCVTLLGRAGSGKSLLAMAGAIHQRKDYLKILISRPVVSLNNKHRLGFIPGGLEEKLAPWVAPLWDNIEVLKEHGDREGIENMLQHKKIQMLPLETIRGRSFYRTIVIIDEAQNLSLEEIKTIGTRIGEGSKLIFTGDVSQVDLRELRGERNGLAMMVQKTKHSPLTAAVQLKRCERSPLTELFTECL